MTWKTERQNAKAAMESIYVYTISKPFCEFDQVLISIIASEMEKNGQRSLRSCQKKTFNESYVKLI